MWKGRCGKTSITQGAQRRDGMSQSNDGSWSRVEIIFKLRTAPAYVNCSLMMEAENLMFIVEMF
jgi:hypothetical protein